MAKFRTMDGTTRVKDIGELYNPAPYETTRVKPSKATNNRKRFKARKKR